MLRRHWTYWTDEELCELIDLWPTHSVAQIAKHLHRSPSATRERARQLLRDGVLEGTMASHNILVGTGSMTRPIRPDLQDFDEVKRDYCRQHHKPEWRKAFEEDLVDSGVHILKFFLHISKDEQKKRLEARLADKNKLWKFNVGDLAERKRWDEYQRAYADALAKCSTEAAPWMVVPANRKWFRNLAVATILAETMAGLKPAYPPEPNLPANLVIE